MHTMSFMSTSPSPPSSPPPLEAPPPLQLEPLSLVVGSEAGSGAAGGGALALPPSHLPPARVMRLPPVRPPGEGEPSFVVCTDPVVIDTTPLFPPGSETRILTPEELNNVVREFMKRTVTVPLDAKPEPPPPAPQPPSSAIKVDTEFNAEPLVLALGALALLAAVAAGYGPVIDGQPAGATAYALLAGMFLMTRPRSAEKNTLYWFLAIVCVWCIGVSERQ